MKIKNLMLVLGLFLFLTAVPALAKENLPKGLENRGPLTKITLIHYRKGYGKPDGVGKPKKPPKDSACYTYLSKGAKWKTTEDYLVNPTNNDDMDQNFVKNAVDAGVTAWEEHGGEIFGQGYIDTSASYSENYDENNTTSFTNLDPGIIGVATVWGFFSGPPKYREIVGWDIRFNDYYDWGDGVNPNLMDLQNIATHELGHAAGMGDLYDVKCNQETMYGYSEYGEIIKRDLNPGDIAGIQGLYQ